MKRFILLIMAVVMLFSGCSPINYIYSQVVDQINDVVQSNDVYVMTIQNATVKDTDYTYKDVFDNFFADPSWRHFTGENGEIVVEFTGECLYDDQEVVALIQFLITDEDDEYIEFEVTYLSFNNVTQTDVMLNTLIEKTLKEYENDYDYDYEHDYEHDYGSEDELI